MSRYMATSNLAAFAALISLAWGAGTAQATNYQLHSEYSFTDGSLLDTGPGGNHLVKLAPGAQTQPGSAAGIPNPPGWGFDPQPDDAAKYNDCGITGCTNGSNAIYSTAGGGLGLNPSMGVKYELSFEANPGLGVNGNLNNPANSPSILLRATGNGADDRIGLANMLLSGVPQGPAELSFSMFNPGLNITETVTIAQETVNGVPWTQANSGYTRVRAGYDPMANVLFLNVSTRSRIDFVSEVFQSAVSAPLPVGWAAGLAAPDQLLIGGETTDGSGTRVVGANLDEYQVFQGVIPEPTSASLTLVMLGGLGLWRRRSA